MCRRSIISGYHLRPEIDFCRSCFSPSTLEPSEAIVKLLQPKGILDIQKYLETATEFDDSIETVVNQTPSLAGMRAIAQALIDPSCKVKNLRLNRCDIGGSIGMQELAQVLEHPVNKIEWLW